MRFEVERRIQRLLRESTLSLFPSILNRVDAIQENDAPSLAGVWSMGDA